MSGDGQYGDATGGEAATAAFASAAASTMPTEHGPTEHGPTEHGPTEHGATEYGATGYGFADQVGAEVAPAVRSFGFELVELDAARLARRSLVRLVVYRAGGMTVDDCAELARAIRYRLALVPGAEDARLEVSSPGTTRKLKAPHEYAIFRGRAAEVLVDDRWVRGVIVAAEGGIVTLDTGTEEQRIELRRIRKGRLSDDMREGHSDKEGDYVQ